MLKGTFPIVALWSGCIGATTSDGAGNTPLDLTIDVGAEMGELFTLADGSMADRAEFTRTFSIASERPDAVVVPVKLAETNVVVPLQANCTTVGLVDERAMFLALGRLDSFSVAGVFAWECDYADGQIIRGEMDQTAFYDPINPPPAL